MSPPGDSRWRGPGPVLLVLLLAVALRIVGFDAEPLQFDEVASWRMTRHERVVDTLRGVAGDVHPPLHFLVLHTVQRVWGGGTIELRAPSFVFGMAALAGLYLLGRRLFGEAEGRLAAALGAVSAPAIYYSQEARPYAMVMCLVTWAAWAWVPLLHLPGRPAGPCWRDRALWVVFATLAAYTHYFGLLAVALQGAVLVARHLARPRDLLLAVATVCAPVLAFVPWFPGLFAGLGREVFWIPRPHANEPWRFLVWQAGGSPGLTVLALALVGVAALAEGIRFVRGPRPPWTTLLLSPELLVAGGFVGPFLVAWGRSLTGVPVLTMRNLLVCLPAGLLLVARAMAALPLPPRASAWAGGVVLSAFLGDLLLVRQFYRLPQRDEYRAAATSLAERLPSTSRALLLACGPGRTLREVLAAQGLDATVQGISCTDAGWDAVETLLDSERPSHVWLLHARSPPGDAFAEGLARRTRLLDLRAWRGTTLVHAADPDLATAGAEAGRWWVRSPLSAGSFVQAEGASMHAHLTEDGLPSVFEMCQALPAAPVAGLVVSGRIRRDLPQPGHAVWVRALFEGDEDRWSRPLFTGEGSEGWVDVRVVVDPPEGTDAVRLCIRTAMPADARGRGLPADLWVEGFGADAAPSSVGEVPVEGAGSEDASPGP